MGMIRIETAGSFGHSEKNFTAMEYGHANAIAEAITYLAYELLPKATAQDHALQAEGAFPNKGFDKSKYEKK